MADSIIIGNNADAAFIEVDAIPAGFSNDGIFYKTVGAKHYKIANDGRIRAIKAGILFDGTDQTARITTVLSHADVRELHFDSYNESITISGTLTIPSGKKLVFKNNCKLIGSGTVDGGIIECDHLKQCFATTLTVTNLENRLVSVKWFGAQSDFVSFASPGTDNHGPFTKAIESIKNTLSASGFYNYSGSVLIPQPQNDNGGYFVGSTITIDRVVDVYSETRDHTLLWFPSSTKAFILNAPDQTGPVVKGGRYITIRNLDIYSQGGSYDGVTNGIEIHTTCKMEGVNVEGFQNNGFHIYAAMPTNNCNLFHLTWCRAAGNKNNGFYVDGPDANAGTFYLCDATGNNQVGFYDSSFLGNTYVGCHAAANGLAASNLGFVSNGGNYYVAYNTNTNIEPGVTSGWESYWIQTDGSFGYYNVWNNATTYLPTSPFKCEGLNNSSLFLGCYSEDGQAYAQNDARGIFIGNTTAMGLDASVAPKISARNGYLEFYNWQTSPREEDNHSHYQHDKTGYRYVDDTYTFNFFKHYSASHILAANYNNVTDYMYWMTPLTPGSWTGRSSTPAAMALNKLFVERGDGNFRQLGMAMAVPASGVWGKGDTLINSDPDTSEVLGWRCTTAGDFAGTPPVFETISFPTTPTGGVDTLNVQYTDAANSGTSETDLMSYTLPANTLLNVGDRVEIEAHFETAANANNKTLIFYFGGYTHTQSPSTISSGTTIKMKMVIIKTGASTQKITREFITSFATSPGTATGSETDTATILIKFTGTSNTASNDITQKTMTVTYYPI